MLTTADRHSSLPRAGRSTDIRIECSAVYTLRCLYMARITSRDNKRFVSHGFCHCARPSLRFSGTRRFVICFGKRRSLDPAAATLLCCGRFILVSTAAWCPRPVGLRYASDHFKFRVRGRPHRQLGVAERGDVG